MRDPQSLGPNRKNKQRKARQSLPILEAPIRRLMGNKSILSPLSVQKSSSESSSTSGDLLHDLESFVNLKCPQWFVASERRDMGLPFAERLSRHDLENKTTAAPEQLSPQPRSVSLEVSLGSRSGLDWPEVGPPGPVTFASFPRGRASEFWSRCP